MSKRAVRADLFNSQAPKQNNILSAFGDDRVKTSLVCSSRVIPREEEEMRKANWVCSVALSQGGCEGIRLVECVPGADRSRAEGHPDSTRGSEDSLGTLRMAPVWRRGVGTPWTAPSGRVGSDVGWQWGSPWAPQRSRRDCPKENPALCEHSPCVGQDAVPFSRSLNE